MQSNLRPIALASLAGGVIFFAFTFFSYAVLPFHSGLWKSYKDEVAVAKVVRENAPAHGLYLLPSMAGGPEGHKVKDLMMFGVVWHGKVGANPTYFVGGLILNVLTALVLTSLLFLTRGLSFTGRIGFFLLVVFVVFLTGPMALWNWWNFPLGYALLELFDLALGWFLAGLVMSKIVGGAYESR